MSTPNVIADGPDSLTARGDLQSGELTGLVAAQNTLTDAQSNLNALAGAVATQVNAVHSAGAGLDGSTGLNFFTVSAGAEGSTISVNPALLADPRKLAAAAVPAGGACLPPETARRRKRSPPCKIPTSPPAR